MKSILYPSWSYLDLKFMYLSLLIHGLQAWDHCPLTSKCKATRVRNALEYLRACSELEVRMRRGATYLICGHTIPWTGTVEATAVLHAAEHAAPTKTATASVCPTQVPSLTCTNSKIGITSLRCHCRRTSGPAPSHSWSHTVQRMHGLTPPAHVSCISSPRPLRVTRCSTCCQAAPIH
jgi:hypothetical protein